MLLFFLFKQKTAYEMRSSDWSSDVCSSDLHAPAAGALRDRRRERRRRGRRRNGAGAAGGCAVKFEAIRRRVERSEQLVDGRALQTGVRADALKSTWRESWTPARIILNTGEARVGEEWGRHVRSRGSPDK